jgi:hypothetical protein
MMLLDKVTELRGLCHTGATCGDVLSSVQTALASLARVDEVLH